MKFRYTFGKQNGILFSKKRKYRIPLVEHGMFIIEQLVSKTNRSNLETENAENSLNKSCVL